MAVRLMNLHRQPLRIDLRGGGVVVVQPGQRSVPLREELLYDNTYLPDWERAGWVMRMPARMQDVLDAEAPAPKATKKRRATKRARKTARAKKGGRRAKTAKTVKRTARKKRP